jgi:hypothetical protein
MCRLPPQKCSLSHSRGGREGTPVQFHHRHWPCMDDMEMNIKQSLKVLAVLALIAASTGVIINTLTTEALELRTLSQVGLYRA